MRDTLRSAALIFLGTVVLGLPCGLAIRAAIAQQEASRGTAGDLECATAGCVSAADIATDAVGAAELANDAVDTAAIAANAVDGTKIALGVQASGNVMYFDGTDWVRLANGTASQVLQTGTPPSWVAAGGSPALTVAFNVPVFGNSGLFTETGVPGGCANLTDRWATLFKLQGSIVTNTLSVNVATGGTAEAKLCIYNEAGTTKEIDVTTPNLALGTVSTAVAAISLAAGNHWLVFGWNTCSAAPALRRYGNIDAALISNAIPTGESQVMGLATHASGVCNTTLGSVTTASVFPVQVRLDN